MNNLTISGNLARDPELQVTSNGTPYARMSIAVREWNGSTKQEETMWLNVVVWNSLAERCERFLSKGMKAFCNGKLSIRKYTNKDGNEATAVEMVAFTVDWDMKASKGDRYKDSGTSSEVTDYSSLGDISPPEE